MHLHDEEGSVPESGYHHDVVKVKLTRDTTAAQLREAVQKTFEIAKDMGFYVSSWEKRKFWHFQYQKELNELIKESCGEMRVDALAYATVEGPAWLKRRNALTVRSGMFKFDDDSDVEVQLNKNTTLDQLKEEARKALNIPQHISFELKSPEIGRRNPYSRWKDGFFVWNEHLSVAAVMNRVGGGRLRVYVHIDNESDGAQALARRLSKLDVEICNVVSVNCQNSRTPMLNS